jgi:hypothetical protein
MNRHDHHGSVAIVGSPLSAISCLVGNACQQARDMNIFVYIRPRNHCASRKQDEVLALLLACIEQAREPVIRHLHDTSVVKVDIKHRLAKAHVCDAYLAKKRVCGMIAMSNAIG